MGDTVTASVADKRKAPPTTGVRHYAQAHDLSVRQEGANGSVRFSGYAIRFDDPTEIFDWLGEGAEGAVAAEETAHDPPPPAQPLHRSPPSALSRNSRAAIHSSNPPVPLPAALAPRQTWIRRKASRKRATSASEAFPAARLSCGLHSGPPPRGTLCTE